MPGLGLTLQRPLVGSGTVPLACSGIVGMKARAVPEIRYSCSLYPRLARSSEELPYGKPCWPAGGTRTRGVEKPESVAEAGTTKPSTHVAMRPTTSEVTWWLRVGITSSPVACEFIVL